MGIANKLDFELMIFQKFATENVYYLCFRCKMWLNKIDFHMLYMGD